MPRNPSDLQDPFPQVRETLAVVSEATGGNFSALERLTTINRKKLKGIVEGEDITLSLTELRQLDQYLATLGVDLFWKKDLPQLLAETQPVAFLLPVSNVPQIGRTGTPRTTTSLWDVRAMNQIRELLGRSMVQSAVLGGLMGKSRDEGAGRRKASPLTVLRQSRQVGFVVQPVPCNQPLSAPGVEDIVQKIINGFPSVPSEIDLPGDRAEPALDVPVAQGNVSQRPSVVISLGSPRASVASELMLRRMFHASKDSGLSRREFFFVWHQPTALDRESLFAESGASPLLAGNESDENSPFKAFDASAPADWFAFRPNETAWQVHRSQRTAQPGGEALWPSYGIVAVQRRGDQIWVVIAGLTGPDTLAAAFRLEMFAPVLAPLHAKGSPSNLSCVVWWVIQTELHDPGNEIATDLRSVRNVQRISGPNYFWPEVE